MATVSNTMLYTIVEDMFGPYLLDISNDHRVIVISLSQGRRINKDRISALSALLSTNDVKIQNNGECGPAKIIYKV